MITFRKWSGSPGVGLGPKVVTADSWYASTANFKFLRNQELSFLSGIEKNRIISTRAGEYQQCVQPVFLLKACTPQRVDFVKVFQTVDKDNNVRYYVYFHPDEEKRQFITRAEFEKTHQQHWQTEVFHRTSKQVCNIEKFFVRTSSSIKTHLFGALRAFIRLSAMVRDQILDSSLSLYTDNSSCKLKESSS